MIVGLTGKMRAGKNECAKRLALMSPLPVVEVSFAAKLKESAAALLGVSVEDLERMKNDPDSHVRVIDTSRSVCTEANTTVDGRSAEVRYLSPPKTRRLTIRELLQRYGTEAHRDVFGQDFWLDAALPLDGIGDDCAVPTNPFTAYSDNLYVVTDVRFPNEAQRVRYLGGIVVKVLGPETDTGSHASEQDLDADYTINNVVRSDGFRALDGQLRDLLNVALGGSRAA